MRQDLIVNAKEERKRKQSINLYDFQFNPLNSVNASNLYSLSNSFTNNNLPGFSAIQSEYDQYLQSCLNYANAYYMHNSMNELNTNLLNSLKANSYATTQSTARPSSSMDALNQLDTLNSLNSLNYSSPVNPFLATSENSNSSLDAAYLSKHLIGGRSPSQAAHSSTLSGSLPSSLSNTYLESVGTALRTSSTSDKLLRDERTAASFLTAAAAAHQSDINQSSSSSPHNLSSHLANAQSGHLSGSTLSSPTSNYRLDDCLSSQFMDKESRKQFTTFFKHRPNESDGEEVSRQIRKLSFAAHNDDNAEDGFVDMYLSEFDKLDLNKLDLNKTARPSFSPSSPSSSSSSVSSHTFTVNQPPSSSTLGQAKSTTKNNYNWKKRKIQYLTDEEIEKENRKVFRTLVKQNQLNQLVRRQRLDEILKASKRIMKQPDYKLNDCKLNEANSISRDHLLEALKWQFFGITKLCKAFQEITAYKQLDETEKKYILMSNCTYILMLSSTKYYNFDTYSWDINVKLNNQESKRMKMPVPVQVMNISGSKKELASYYVKFMEIFDRTWLEDEILMSLIFVICLFTPDEKLIKKIHNIK